MLAPTCNPATPSLVMYPRIANRQTIRVTKRFSMRTESTQLSYNAGTYSRTVYPVSHILSGNVHFKVPAWQNRFATFDPLDEVDQNLLLLLLLQTQENKIIRQISTVMAKMEEKEDGLVSKSRKKAPVPCLVSLHWKPSVCYSVYTSNSPLHGNLRRLGGNCQPVADAG